MTAKMNIETLLQGLLAISNAYDTKSYLEKWNKTAALYDPSVGQVFRGHPGIKEYF